MFKRFVNYVFGSEWSTPTPCENICVIKCEPPPTCDSIDSSEAVDVSKNDPEYPEPPAYFTDVQREKWNKIIDKFRQFKMADGARYSQFFSGGSKEINEKIQVSWCHENIFQSFDLPQGPVVVKLMISRNGESSVGKNLVARMFGAKFNCCHTSITLHSKKGAKLIDWNSNSLTYTRNVASSTAILHVDLATLTLPKDKERFIALAKVMEHWNVNIYYDALHSNCQHFVDAALRALDIKIDSNKDNILGDYLENIRKGDTGKVVPAKSGSVIKKKKDFKTHEELDEYVWQLLSELYKDENTDRETLTAEQKKILVTRFQYDDEATHNLLKGFDRAFWVLSISTDEQKKNGKPLMRKAGKVESGGVEVDIHEICCPWHPFNQMTVVPAIEAFHHMPPKHVEQKSKPVTL
eukprot:TRINITY_DN592_c0_g1_i1.p1 TRINITY_DN592_c0_g1~~TRINITY_DN592_c0_g1_i1.p1  ORF type:complete len:408 (-),score=86.98 TRINITY_DN592_c0_g1_i1:97-1320(-)